jgi:hypothetical protein
MRSLHNSVALDLPYLFPRSTGASLRAANRLLHLDVLLRRHAHDATLWRSSKAHALQLITTLAAPRADASEASSSTAAMPKRCVVRINARALPCHANYLHAKSAMRQSPVGSKRMRDVAFLFFTVQIAAPPEEGAQPRDDSA